MTVKTEFLNPADSSVAASGEKQLTVGQGEKQKAEYDISVENARLWSTDTPELYTVRTTVMKDGQVTDTQDTTFGIRTIEWKRGSQKGENGCYINGKRVELNGVNLHSETYMLGNAMSDDAIYAEIKRLREYGFNFVRMAHYPHSQAFYEACDRYGVAVVDCLSGWQYFNNSNAFKDNTYQQIREMVRASRNHPSIVAWEPSLNESRFNKAWADRANQVTKEEYPENGKAKAWTCGWIEWNSYDFGVGTPQASVKRDAEKNHTDKAVIVSEYGDWNYGGYKSTTRVTREPAHYKNVKGGDEGMLIQCDNIQSSYSWNRQQNWNGAAAYWQYADYAGFDEEKLTYCGVVDVARIPKHGAYFFQSQRDPKVDMSAYGLDSGPMIYIANTWASDSPKDVRVYTNCDTVELYYNGDLIEKKTDADNEMWDPRAKLQDGTGGDKPEKLEGQGEMVSTEHIEYPPFTFNLTDKATPGEGTLTVKGYINGEEEPAAEFTRSAPGAASKLELEAENQEPLKLDGSTAKLVWVRVQDANGTTVNTANDTVKFSTEGPGYVVGSKEVGVRGGEWAVWVRGQRETAQTRETGQPIVLKAESGSLEGAQIEIATETVPGLPDKPAEGDRDDDGFEQPALPVNIMEGKAATASSVNTAGGGKKEEASDAVDGNSETKWCADAGNESDYDSLKHWLQVDLGSSFDISDMSIEFDSGPKNGKSYKYRVEVADNPELFGTENEGVFKTSEKTAQEQNSILSSEELKGAHGRYVRIWLNCPAGDMWPCIREVSAHGTTDNIAMYKEATAQNNSEDAGKAVDGNAETHWNSGNAATNDWWQIDLGSEYLVNSASVSFKWKDDGLKRNFKVLYSSDKESWNELQAVTDSSQHEIEFTIPDGGIEAQYIRLADFDIKNASNQTQWREVAEFAAAGTPLEVRQEFGYGKKTEASSCADGVTPGDGNEGNPVLFWRPAAEDTDPYWILDTEGIYDLRSLKMTWNTEEEHMYKVEISSDKKNWTEVVNHMEETNAGTYTTDNFKVTGRYLRIKVPQGTTQGFWVKLWGRPMEADKTAVSVEEEAISITGKAGTALNELGLPAEVNVKLDDDTKTRLGVDWSNNPNYDPNSAEAQTLNGTVQAIPGVTLGESGMTVQATVTLEAAPIVLTGLEVTPPTKTEYKKGEQLNLEGMKATAVYTDSLTGAVKERKDVTGEILPENVTGYDPAKTGQQIVTVTYQNVSGTFAIFVKEDSQEPTDPGKDPSQEPGKVPGGQDKADGSGGGKPDPAKDGSNAAVKTGDSGNLLLPAAGAVLSVLALAGIGILYLKRRKNSK